jgi:hypothetical protein
LTLWNNLITQSILRPRYSINGERPSFDGDTAPLVELTRTGMVRPVLEIDDEIDESNFLQEPPKPAKFRHERQWKSFSGGGASRRFL